MNHCVILIWLRKLKTKKPRVLWSDKEARSNRDEIASLILHVKERQIDIKVLQGALYKAEGTDGLGNIRFR